MYTLDPNANLEVLANEKYIGRIVVQGRGIDGAIYQITGATGRSEGSRNRAYKPEKGKHGWLRTVVADPRKEVGDPTTTLYPAMAETFAHYVATNGQQTAALVESFTGRFGNIRDVPSVLSQWQYESDKIATPRISAILRLQAGGGVEAQMSILRKSPDDDSCDRVLWDQESLAPGIGYALVTYMHDGNPPPHYVGDPFRVPLEGNIRGILEQYCAALDPANFVCLAVKRIDTSGTSEGTSEIAYKNKYEIIEA